jgi:hypothetical protein
MCRGMGEAYRRLFIICVSLMVIVISIAGLVVYWYW